MKIKQLDKRKLQCPICFRGSCKRRCQVLKTIKFFLCAEIAFKFTSTFATASLACRRCSNHSLSGNQHIPNYLTRFSPTSFRPRLRRLLQFQLEIHCVMVPSGSLLAPAGDHQGLECTLCS